MLRWIFASVRPNTEFQISFDLDVIKLYEDYDRARRLACESDDGGKNDKKRQIARRTLQLASLDHHRLEPGKEQPFVPPFRGLSTILQIYDGDLARSLEHYERTGEIRTQVERDRFEVRARCVWRWLEKYAPEDFRYRIRELPLQQPLEAEPRELLGRLVAALEAAPDLDESALVEILKNLCEGSRLQPTDFFPYAYELLLGRPKGPRLSTLIDHDGCRAGPAAAAGRPRQRGWRSLRAARGLLPAALLAGGLCACSPPEPTRPVGSGGRVARIRRRRGGSRYSPLTQITRENVHALEPAWIFHTGTSITAARP